MDEMELGMMRIGTLFLKLHFFNKEKEARQRLLVDLVRQQTYILVNIQLDRKSKLKSVSDLWPMPWDESQEVELPDVKDSMERINELSKLL